MLRVMLNVTLIDRKRVELLYFNVKSFDQCLYNLFYKNQRPLDYIKNQLNNTDRIQKTIMKLFRQR